MAESRFYVEFFHSVHGQVVWPFDDMPDGRKDFPTLGGALGVCMTLKREGTNSWVKVVNSYGNESPGWTHTIMSPNLETGMFECRI